jgi:hypothetical protein
MKWSQEVLISGFVWAFAVFAPALRGQIFDTNDLWLKIALTNNAAAFTIHAPATNANGVYDLYFSPIIRIGRGCSGVLRVKPIL